MQRNWFWFLVGLSAVMLAVNAPISAGAALPDVPIPVTDTPPTSAVTGFAQATQIPSLETFAATLNQGQPGVTAGVYVAGTFAVRVVKQVANNPAYVSPINGTVTQFGLAMQQGTIGLLAHNYLTGAHFSKLALGQEIDIVDGDASVRRYFVSSIRRFQALNPTSPYSTFVDAENGGTQLSSTDLFNLMYSGGNKVVLQTCIYANGSWSWGRLFVTAMPR
jgi:hypothetical protein